MSRISKKWKIASEDQTLWKDLFYSAGWSSNKETIHEYLSNKPIKTSLASCIPRTVDARLKPFKRSTDFDLARYTSKSSSNSLAIRPTQVYPSRSHPCSSSNHSSNNYSNNNHSSSSSSSIISVNTNREALSHLIMERPFLNRPPPRRHVKYDETAIFHYKETFDSRFINWKRLYRNRNTIERRWQEGRCKVKQFPPPVKHELIVDETQHNGGIYCLQFDNSILVTGSRDRNLKVWDIKTGRLKFTLEGHSGSVLCLQFDHRYLITGSSDSTLIVWDIHTGEKIKSLVGHGESVLNVKLLGNTVVSCSKDRTVRIWDLEKGTLEMTLRGHRAAVNAVQFKHDKIVSASGDRTIKIWDIVSIPLYTNMSTNRLTKKNYRTRVNV